MICMLLANVDHFQCAGIVRFVDIHTDAFVESVFEFNLDEVPTGELILPSIEMPNGLLIRRHGHPPRAIGTEHQRVRRIAVQREYLRIGAKIRSDIAIASIRSILRGEFMNLDRTLLAWTVRRQQRRVRIHCVGIERDTLIPLVGMKK